MAGKAESFFMDLVRREQVPTLTRAHGIIRFELTGSAVAQTWMVRIDRGVARVSRDDAGADCVVRMDETLFDEVVSGQLNAMAAMLRGDLVVEGDPELLVLGQRLFPAKRREQATVPEKGRRP